MEFWQALELTVFVLFLTVALVVTVAAFASIGIDCIEEWREARAQRLEAELDARAERVRATVLSLAEDFASDRDEASRELTRAMFLTTGETPTPKA